MYIINLLKKGVRDKENKRNFMKDSATHIVTFVLLEF
jgi:hypothetical protein